ncbi:hypothetical protein Q757_08335, partial [Oenococcus alcoholitolerans]
MIWGRKISYSDYFHEELVKAVGRLQDDYNAAVQTERNL